MFLNKMYSTLEILVEIQSYTPFSPQNPAPLRIIEFYQCNRSSICPDTPFKSGGRCFDLWHSAITIGKRSTQSEFVLRVRIGNCNNAGLDAI